MKDCACPRPALPRSTTALLGLAALAACLAPQAGPGLAAQQGAAFSSHTNARMRALVYEDPTSDATDHFVLDVDFKWPADAATAYNNRLFSYIYFLRASPGGDSGTMTFPAAAQGAFVSIEPQQSSPTWRISLHEDPTGAGSAPIGSAVIPYDNEWHRLSITVAPGNTVSVNVDGGNHINATLSANPGGEHVGIAQRVFNVADAALNPRFDNLRVDGVPFQDFATIGSPTFNVAGIWQVDPAEESTYSEPPPPEPRLMEKLGRGVVAINRGGGNVFVSWRMLGLDPESIAFNVYRAVGAGAPIKRNAAPIADVTFFQDTGASFSQPLAYTVRPVLDGIEGPPSAPFTFPAAAPVRPFLELPLQQPPAGTTPLGDTYTHDANDATVADLDGDAELEIILRWEPTNSWGGGMPFNDVPGHTGPVIVDAYKLDGTLLWRINLGPNINACAHITQLIAYDLDSDGRAEVALQTADGTIDGAGNIIGDPAADHRDPFGKVLAGREYLTIFDGETGAELVTTDYFPQRHPATDFPTRSQVADIWGDDYGNRSNRWMAAIAYLDGRRPSLVTSRGIYKGQGSRPGRTALAAYDWRDGVLTRRWTIDTLDNPALDDYRGQGNHNLYIGDVDEDGRDEIIYGACAFDDDGSPLYSTLLGHGDALHLSDMDPARPGLEVFAIHEGTAHDAGMEFRDARTGAAIWKKYPNLDIGRGIAIDVDPAHLGHEMWGVQGATYNTQGDLIYNVAPTDDRFANMAIWWDGDLMREMLDGELIDKWNATTRTKSRLLTGYQSPYFGTSNNGTKKNPVLCADILGDWREELIVRNAENTRLAIITTTIPTTYRFRALLHDPIYRLSVATQNVGYNMPSHTGFYLGTGMDYPPPAPSIEIVGEAPLSAWMMR